MRVWVVIESGELRAPVHRTREGALLHAAEIRSSIGGFWDEWVSSSELTFCWEREGKEDTVVVECSELEEDGSN